MRAKVGPLPAWAWGALLLGVVGAVILLRKNAAGGAVAFDGGTVPGTGDGTGTTTSPFPPQAPLVIVGPGESGECVYDPNTGKLICPPALPVPPAPPAPKPPDQPAGPVVIRPIGRIRPPRGPRWKFPRWRPIVPGTLPPMPAGGYHFKHGLHGPTTSPSVPAPTFHWPADLRAPAAPQFRRANVHVPAGSGAPEPRLPRHLATL